MEFISMNQLSSFSEYKNNNKDGFHFMWKVVKSTNNSSGCNESSLAGGAYSLITSSESIECNPMDINQNTNKALNRIVLRFSVYKNGLELFSDKEFVEDCQMKYQGLKTQINDMKLDKKE